MAKKVQPKPAPPEPTRVPADPPPKADHHKPKADPQAEHHKPKKDRAALQQEYDEQLELCSARPPGKGADPARLHALAYLLADAQT